MATKTAAPEQLDLGRSYVRDGILRAYANRFGLLAVLFGVIALVSLGFAIYVRLQPPTVFRTTPDGETTVISGRTYRKARSAILADSPTSTEPMEYEKERLIRDFLDDYLNYDYRNVGERWANALNLCEDRLSASALDVIKKEDRVSQVRAAQLRSTFEIREIQPSKQDPMDFTVFGIRNVYRMDGVREIAEQMVNRYEIRLAMPDRSEKTPRGLLIATYSEIQLEGETKEPSFAVDTGGIAPTTGIGTSSSPGQQ
jgi:hypothetical protein